MLDDGYCEPMDAMSQQQAMGQTESSKLPPVLANLMVNLSNSSRSPQATSAASNPVAPSVNVHELLSSIMVNNLQDMLNHYHRCFPFLLLIYLMLLLATDRAVGIMIFRAVRLFSCPVYFVNVHEHIEEFSSDFVRMSTMFQG